MSDERRPGRGVASSSSTWVRSTTTTSWTRPEHRRGVQSVNARWGNLVAIVAGDFLLARASEIAASLGTEVAGLLAADHRPALRGRGRPSCGRRSTRPAPKTPYFGAIAGKTASLMATSCRIGGLTSGATAGRIDALTAFGQAFGMRFQICDDILDLVGTDEDLGKPAGHDLVEGIYTLPVLRALAVPEVERGAAGPARRPASTPRPGTRPGT